MESNIDESFEKIHPTSPTKIRKIADNSGLSYISIKNTLRKGEKLKLFSNSFEDLKSTTTGKFEKDVCRIQLNEMVNDGFLEDICKSLTLLEEIITKAVNENEGKKCEFADDFNSWLKIGLNIKFFHPDEKGLNLFKSISALSPKYKRKRM